MIGVLFAGARQLSSREHLKILADIAVELTNLPDLGPVVVQPGERIKLPCLTGGELWSGLPNFALSIGEDLNRGSPYFFHESETGRYDQEQIHRQAEDIYTNVNTLAALIAQQRPPQTSPLSSYLHSAFAVFAFMEHGPDTARGKFSHLVVRAAASRLTIADEKLVGLGPSCTNYDYISGSLWAAEAGTDTVNVKRLRFWKAKFRQLQESGRLLSQEAIVTTNDAAIAIDKLISV